jgi:hypothetical protein
VSFKKKKKNRHCNCVYYHDWHRTKRPKRANDGGGLLHAVSHALTPLPPPSSTSSAQASASNTPFTSPRNTLAPTSGVLIAFNDAAPPATTAAPQSATPPSVFMQTQGAGAGASAAATGAGYAGLPFDEEAKLVYGVILSLRNMIKHLSGRFVVSSIFLSPFSVFFWDIEPRTRVPSICFPFDFLCTITGMSLLSAIAHPRTNYTSLKPSPAIASSC